MLITKLLPGEIALIENLGKVIPTNVLVDVGCSFGEYTNVLRASYPEAKIYSFDPQAGTPAIGAADGELEMRLFPTCPERSSGATGYFDRVQGVHVTRTFPLRRLDSLVSEDIDFLKIDTEGMEMDVLQGLGTLWPKVIQFEYGYASNLHGTDLCHFGEFFYTRGYTLQQIDWHANWGNWIAAPPEVVSKLMQCIIHR